MDLLGQQVKEGDLVLYKDQICVVKRIQEKEINAYKKVKYCNITLVSVKNSGHLKYYKTTRVKEILVLPKYYKYLLSKKRRIELEREIYVINQNH